MARSDSDRREEDEEDEQERRVRALTIGDDVFLRRSGLSIATGFAPDIYGEEFGIEGESGSRGPVEVFLVDLAPGVFGSMFPTIEDRRRGVAPRLFPDLTPGDADAADGSINALHALDAERLQVLSSTGASNQELIDAALTPGGIQSLNRSGAISPDEARTGIVGRFGGGDDGAVDILSVALGGPLTSAVGRLVAPNVGRFAAAGYTRATAQSATTAEVAFARHAAATGITSPGSNLDAISAGRVITSRGYTGQTAPAYLVEEIAETGGLGLSLIHISEPTRLLSISYAVFCLKKKK